MDPILTMLLGLLMRWIHVMTVALLIGGVFYARLAGSRVAPEFLSKIYWLAGALFVSGLYNFLTKSSYPPHYHVWFGIKFLLALHVLSMLILLARPGIEDLKRRRWMSSILYSGTAVIAISSVLRWLTLHSAVPQLP
jgi:hypothetical protein